MLKQKIDGNISKIYDLTIVIKALENRLETNPDKGEYKEIKMKADLVKVLITYEKLRSQTLELLDDYFREEVGHGNVADLPYRSLYRKLSA